MVIDKLPGKRILVIRYRFLGDTILTVPFLRNLRYAYPEGETRIDMLVGPASGEVLDGCPYVDNFIVYDTSRFHKYEQGKSKKRSFMSYALDLRKEDYDLVFVLKRSWSSALLALATGARYRVGYATEGRSIILTHPVPFNEKEHEVQSVLDVARAAGIEIRDDHLEAWISEAERASIEEKVPELKEDGPKVLIHAAAAHPDKMYTKQGWVELIRRLHEDYNFVPFFTGAGQDRTLYSEIAALSGVKSVNMAGGLSIRESMALYQKMDLAICVDSGPAHLACATGVPTFALFGPTDPERWAPYGNNSRAIYDNNLDCRPCNYKKTCQNRECLTELSPGTILEALKENQILKSGETGGEKL